MRYSVTIPKAKSDRMNKENKTLIIEQSDGWVGYPPKRITLKPEVIHCEFEIPDDFEYVYNTKTIDGPTFNVKIEYANSSGSRKETYQLVPQIEEE